MANDWKATCITVPGHVQWIIMCIGPKRVEFLNLYAPNAAGGQAEFWNQIVDALPVAEHWCIGADFNMPEIPEDRQVLSLQLGSFYSFFSGFQMLCMLIDTTLPPPPSKKKRLLSFSKGHSNFPDVLDDEGNVLSFPCCWQITMHYRPLWSMMETTCILVPGCAQWIIMHDVGPYWWMGGVLESDCGCSSALVWRR